MCVTLAQARISERQGDYVEASQHYNYVREVSHGKPLPELTFNVARLDVLEEDFDRAMDGFEKYLKEVPDAPDAVQVKQLVAELRKKPRWTYVSTLVSSDEDPEATVIVDGEKLGPAPQRIPTDDKIHDVARIGKTQLEVRDVSTGKAMQSGSGGTSSGKGNVWLDFGHYGVDGLELSGQPIALGKLISLRPGRYSTAFGPQLKLCSPFEFEVKPGATLTYVYLQTVAGDVTGDYSCMKIVKVRTHYSPWEPR